MGIWAFNWFDVAIGLLILLYTWQGYDRGLYLVLPECLSWLIAWTAGIFGAEWLAGLMVKNFDFWARSAWIWAFIIIMVFVEQFSFRALMGLFALSPRQYSSKGWQLMWGFIPAMISGLLIMAFLTLLLVRIPVGYPFKTDIATSRFGQWVTGSVESVHAVLIRDGLYLHLQ